MADYTGAVYDYLRTLGDVGEQVRSAIHPYLIQTFDLTPEHAQLVRAKAMQDLKSRGMVRRLNTRGAYLEILTEYYADPLMDPDGKFVESGLRRLD